MTLPYEASQLDADMPAFAFDEALRQYAVPDEYNRVSPFAIFGITPTGFHRTLARNLSLDNALSEARVFADRGYRQVVVALDTCG